MVVGVMPRVLSWRHSGVTTCRAKAAQPGGHRAERCHWDAEFRSPRKWDGIWSNCLQERWASLQAGLLGSGYYGGIILLQGLDAFLFQTGEAIVHGRLQKSKWHITRSQNNENPVIPGLKIIEYNKPVRE